VYSSIHDTINWSSRKKMHPPKSCNCLKVYKTPAVERKRSLEAHRRRNSISWERREGNEVEAEEKAAAPDKRSLPRS
jgi:hypothetical protein